jgi:cobyrinic acid a,c-diamide synthase
MNSSLPLSPEKKSGGLILAGMMSGSGKTAVASLLLAAWKVAGYQPRPFKVGPDYLDTGYHKQFAGIPSRNLDVWLMGEASVLEQTASSMKNGGIGLIEGVMGLVDGAHPTDDFGSTLHVARILGWPVVLVAPCAKVGRSLGAALRGFRDTAAETGVRIAGVILNTVGGEAHADYLRKALEPLHLPVLGAVPRLPELTWKERHLGLQTSHEQTLPTPEEMAAVANRYLDLDALLALAQGATIPPPSARVAMDGPALLGKTIALAQDDAFHFYYPGNLEFLQAHGATLTSFSPLRDAHLPEGTTAVWLGGGFPELFAEALAANDSLRAELMDWANAGKPLLAECGGFMYAMDGIKDHEEARHPMVGIVPGTCSMTRRLQHFGYSLCLSPDKEQSLARGHEFHYSQWDQEPDLANLWRVRKQVSGRERREGYRRDRVRATYVHTWFPASPAYALETFGGEPVDILSS